MAVAALLRCYKSVVKRCGIPGCGDMTVIAFRICLYMLRVLSGSNTTVMTEAAGACYRGMIYPGNMVEFNGVMAVVAQIR